MDWNSFGFHESVEKFRAQYLELIGIRPPEDLEEHLATMSMLEGAEYFHRELGVKATPQEIIRGLNRQIEDATGRPCL